MFILNRPIHRLPAFRKGILALLAVATLGASSTSSLAGGAELKALQNALPANLPIALATSQQLLNAYLAVIVQTKFSSDKRKAITAGEALKAAGVNAQNAGQFFADAIVVEGLSPTSTSPLRGIFLDRVNFVPLTAKTAGSGKGLNVLQIPTLSATLFATDLSTNFNTAAVNAKNKAGAGAILGGNALKLVRQNPATAAAGSVDIANAALAERALRSAAQDVLRYITAELVDVANTATFAVTVGNGNSGDNSRFAAQIAVGAAAGDPTNAGNIAHNILGQQVLNDNGTASNAPVAPIPGLRAAAFKGLTKIVKSMAAFADIEEIQKIGNAVGQGIRTTDVKLAKAASTTRVLAQAVMNKPSVNSFGEALSQNTALNKQDELVEVAVYMLSGLSGSAELNALNSTEGRQRAAAKRLFAILTAVSKVKPNNVIGGPGLSGYSADLAGSFAYTVSISTTISQGIRTAFQALMTDAKTAAKIDKNNVSAIQSVIGSVYSGDTSVISLLENGSLGNAVSDPETDFRPFNNPPNGQS